MRVSIFLGPEEIKEAILDYLKNHRPDFVDENQGIQQPPPIVFLRNSEEIDVVAARIDQHMPVHNGNHPYR